MSTTESNSQQNCSCKHDCSFHICSMQQKSDTAIVQHVECMHSSAGEATVNATYCKAHVRCMSRTSQSGKSVQRDADKRLRRRSKK